MTGIASDQLPAAPTARMEAAGRFVRLLRKPKIACKPKGDMDPIPEEWGVDDPKADAEPVQEDEDKEEEAWRASTAAMEGEPTALAKNEAGEEQEEEEYQEEAEEEVVADDPADDPADDADDDDHNEEDDEEHDDGQQLHSNEYNEMDKQMQGLKKFVENEHSKKAEKDNAYDNGKRQEWYSNKYRNKGKGQDWSWNSKGNYGKGWKGKGWQKRSPKGKGKWNWGKWQSKWEDWGPKRHGDHEGHGDADMLVPDGKGNGYYLPNGQGFLTKDGVYHPHLGYIDFCGDPECASCSCAYNVNSCHEIIKT